MTNADFGKIVGESVRYIQTATGLEKTGTIIASVSIDGEIFVYIKTHDNRVHSLNLETVVFCPTSED